MGIQQTYVEKPSPETIWAILREVSQAQKELTEQMKETDKQMKETNRQMKETDRRFGFMGNRFGEILEYIIKPNLLKSFQELGFVFTIAHQNTRIVDKKNKIITEVDYTLENGDKVMIVEAKSKPTTSDITDHIERMKKVASHASMHGDRRLFFGVVAGVIINDNEREFALKNGLYVIEPSGEIFTITAPEGIYSPRTSWQDEK